MGYVSAIGDVTPRESLQASIALFLHNRIKSGWSEEAARKALLSDAASPCVADGKSTCTAADVNAGFSLVPELARQQKAIDGSRKPRPVTFDHVLLLAGLGALALLVLVPAPRKRRR